MKNMYILLGILVIVLFINSYLNNNLTKEIGEFPVPQTTTVSKRLSKEENPLPTIENTVVNEKPLQVIRNLSEPIIPKPEYLKEDIISPNPIDSTEYRFVEENQDNAWSEIDVSQHPSYHKSNFNSELTNPGGFFKYDNEFNDKTSPKSENHLPDRCFIDNNSNIVCEFNDKIQNIPPKLITNGNENKVLNSIGDIERKEIHSKAISSLQGNSYDTFYYDNEKTINGGGFFGDVLASSSSNESPLALDNIPKINYAL